MSLGKNSDRKVVTLSIKKVNYELLRSAANATNRNIGKMLDCLIEKNLKGSVND